MIKNKEELKRKLIERLTEKADEYVEKMDKESNNEFYPIDVIERDLVNIQKESTKIFRETTEELINSIDEEEEIKKKQKMKN